MENPQGKMVLLSSFTQSFFDLIGNDLVESLNAAYENGQLSISQRRDVINPNTKRRIIATRAKELETNNSLEC